MKGPGGPAKPGRKVGRSQGIYAVLDQALSSATNVLVVVLAARSLGPYEFGAFSAVYIGYTILVGASAAVIGQVIVLRTRENSDLEKEIRGSIAFALVFGAVAGVACLLVAVILEQVRGPLVALAIFLPLLFAQDTARYGASALHKMEVAVLSDATWLVMLLLLGAVLELSNYTLTATSALAAWALAGSGAGLLWFRLLGSFRPMPSIRGYLRRDFLGYRFIAEYVILRALSQGFTLLLGVMAGLAVTGAIRGVTTLFGPLMVSMAAAASFGAPLVGRLPAGKRDRFVLILTGALVAVSVLCAAGVAFLPDVAGEAVLGESWAGAQAFVPAMSLQVLFAAVTTTTYLALRLTAPRSTLNLRLLVAALLPGLFFLGYAVGGPVGAFWGLTAASGAQALAGATFYLRERSHGRGLSSI